MRIVFPVAALLALLMGHAAADPLADAPPQPQIDPSPDQGSNFPPGVATMGIAVVSPQMVSAPADNKTGCTALNPCAIPTPSRDRVETPQAAKPAGH